MFVFVTSFTREPVAIEHVKLLSPSVLSIVLNKARRSPDLQLYPYERVLKDNQQRQIQVVSTPKGFIVLDRHGAPWGTPHLCEAAARLAHWKAHQSTTMAKRRPSALAATRDA